MDGWIATGGLKASNKNFLSFLKITSNREKKKNEITQGVVRKIKPDHVGIVGNVM